MTVEKRTAGKCIRCKEIKDIKKGHKKCDKCIVAAAKEERYTYEGFTRRVLSSWRQHIESGLRIRDFNRDRAIDFEHEEMVGALMAISEFKTLYDNWPKAKKVTKTSVSLRCKNSSKIYKKDIMLMIGSVHGYPVFDEERDLLSDLDQEDDAVKHTMQENDGVEIIPEVTIETPKPTVVVPDVVVPPRPKIGVNYLSANNNYLVRVLSIIDDNSPILGKEVPTMYFWLGIELNKNREETSRVYFHTGIEMITRGGKNLAPLTVWAEFQTQREIYAALDKGHVLRNVVNNTKARYNEDDVLVDAMNKELFFGKLTLSDWVTEA